MKVLFVTPEAAPFAKTGGLGDVAGSLPAALNKKRAYTRVMMPLYQAVSEQWRAQMTFEKYFYVWLGWRRLYCGIFKLKHEGTVYYFIDNEYYFKRPSLYGHFDDAERFAFFSRAAAQAITELDWVPDVVHCNDWQTALVPIYMKDLSDAFPQLAAIKTVFTIHNTEYQGQYGTEILGDVFGLNEGWFHGGILAFSGDINLMKGAIVASDAVTTVSPTYAKELQHGFYARGLETVFQANENKLSGILNGIDQTVYDPKADPRIFAGYTAADMAGKAENKKELQHILGLKEDPDIPIIACVSRMVAHKGFDLILGALSSIMWLDVQFVVLGTGEWSYEQAFKHSEGFDRSKLSVNITYSDELAMRIYAGADIFLMPSRAEPCGLSQMIAMRYGTVPVVRETGGLKDTVLPYNAATGEGNGFTFANYTIEDMMHVLSNAVDTYRNNPEVWRGLQLAGMKTDFSWSASAGEYKKLYTALTGKK
ncbi:glycogen synthase GlgA [Oscillospiraceae bacterium OttesenSCG-928-F05]|nr:glycogen synthase GlgA [Oscillospiraceae bacterium OttesenSCG-928-F05]